MTDVVDEALRAVGTRAATAYPLVFAAGVVTSAGPCAAARYVAVSGIAHAARRPWTVIGAFAAGLVAAYVALGLAVGGLALGSGTLPLLQANSPTVYTSLAVALAVAGVVTLVRAEPHASHVRHRTARAAGAGGVFLLGASSVLVVSPCCTPIVAAVTALTLSIDGIGHTALLLTAFGCGHAMPVVAVAAAGIRASQALRRIAASQGPAIVAGGLMFALAAFYGALA